MSSMSEGFVTRYWLVGAIAAAVAVALLFPQGAAVLPDYHIIDIGVVAVMFLGALKLAPSRFREAVGRADLLVLSVISVFVIAPAASLAVAWLFGLDSAEDGVAVLICSAQASTLATAIVLTEVAGGDVALAMVMTVVNNVATVVLTPLIFKVAADTEIEVDHLGMAGEMALKIVAPVLAAQVARIWLGEWAVRHKRKLSVSSQIIILVYIYTGVGAAASRLEGLGGALLKVVGIVAVLHGLMLLLNALISRVAVREPGRRTAFVLCSSQKTLPAAILIWQSYFPALPLGPLVAVTHHMLQLVTDSLLAPDFLRLPLIRNRSRSKTTKGESNG